jgi:PAS domain S-box-containing protein
MGRPDSGDGARGADSLKVLILEDAPTDAELMQRSLRAGGMKVIAKRVETEPEFAAALEQFAPDVVLADFKLPRYDGLSAIRLVHDTHPNLPVIVVTGALSDETAVDLIKAGAADYILKDRLARLPAAVQHALHDAAQSRSLREHEAEVRAAERKLQAIAAYSHDAIIMMNESMVITFWNKAAEICFGYGVKEAVGRDIYSFLASDVEADAVRRQVEQFMTADRNHLAGWTHKLGIKKQDGSALPIDLSISFVRMDTRWSVIGVGRPQMIAF